MKEVEKKDLPEIPGGAVWPYPDPDSRPSGPLFPDYPRCPITRDEFLTARFRHKVPPNFLLRLLLTRRFSFNCV